MEEHSKSGDRVSCVSAVAAVTVAAGAAGVAAGRGDAAPAQKAHHASHLRRAGHGEQAQLKHGVLRSRAPTGNDGSRLASRPVSPDALEVDFDDDGSPDFKLHPHATSPRSPSSLDRTTTGCASTSSGRCRSPTAVPTTLDGEAGTTRCAGGSGARRCSAATATTRSTATAATTPRSSAPATTCSSGSRRRQRRRRRPGRQRHDALQRRQHRRAARSLRHRRPPAVHPHHANITMDTDDVERVDFNALGGADTVTVNDLTATDVKQRQHRPGRTQRRRGDVRPTM